MQAGKSFLKTPVITHIKAFLTGFVHALVSYFRSSSPEGSAGVHHFIAHDALLLEY
jgi:hypothetical protein